MRLLAISALPVLLLGCLAPNAPAPNAPNASEAPAAPGARDAPQAPAPDLPRALDLRFDQAAAGGECRVRLLELEDSRCPVGVQCVWEGRAAVTVEVRRGDSPPESVELILQAGRDELALPAAGCELRLLGVEPYPREGVTPERRDVVATVEVRPRPR